MFYRGTGRMLDQMPLGKNPLPRAIDCQRFTEAQRILPGKHGCQLARYFADIGQIPP